MNDCTRRPVSRSTAARNVRSRLNWNVVRTSRTVSARSTSTSVRSATVSTSRSTRHDEVVPDVGLGLRGALAVVLGVDAHDRLRDRRAHRAVDRRREPARCGARHRRAGEAASSMPPSSPQIRVCNRTLAQTRSNRTAPRGSAVARLRRVAAAGSTRRRRAARSRRGPSAGRARWSPTAGGRRPCPASVRCERRSETSTPSGTTRPQRSARHHSSASRRSSTRVRCAIACITTSRSARRAARSSSAAKTSGHCAARTAKAWSMIATRVGRQRGPLDRARQQLLVLGVVPRAQHVARAEQLGRRVVVDRRLAHQQALEEQQADRPRALEQAVAGHPAPARDVDRARVEPLRGLARAPRSSSRARSGSTIQELDRAAASFWHAVSFQIRSRRRCPAVRSRGPWVGPCVRPAADLSGVTRCPPPAEGPPRHASM